MFPSEIHQIFQPAMTVVSVCARVCVRARARASAIRLCVCVCVLFVCLCICVCGMCSIVNL